MFLKIRKQPPLNEAFAIVSDVARVEHNDCVAALQAECQSYPSYLYQDGKPDSRLVSHIEYQCFGSDVVHHCFAELNAAYVLNDSGKTVDRF